MTSDSSIDHTRSFSSDAKGAMIDVYGEAKPKLRGLVHAWATLPVGVAAAAVAAFAPAGQARWSVLVYALAVSGMLTASACYHRLRVSSTTRNYLRRLDHSMIGVAVAGTYTPVLVLTLDGTLRTTLLAVLWVGALSAMLVSVLWLSAPSWVRALLYVALGWAGAIAMPWIYTNGGAAAFTFVLLGAGLYTLGALAYATRKPNPWPRIFGFHEVFHSLVLAAVLAHLTAVALVVNHAT